MTLKLFNKSLTDLTGLGFLQDSNSGISPKAKNCIDFAINAAEIIETTHNTQTLESVLKRSKKRFLITLSMFGIAIKIARKAYVCRIEKDKMAAIKF